MLTDIQNYQNVIEDGKVQGIKLIDFGRAINARAISSPFSGRCYTSGFMCPQMVDNKPWRYQVCDNS